MTSSGRCAKLYENGDWLWSGDHDCREALVHHIQGLGGAGKFVTPWVDDPRVWYSHSADEKPLEDTAWAERLKLYDRIDAERKAMLPQAVQDAITPQETP